MGFFKKYSAKFFLKQWNIGLANGDIGDIIRLKKPVPDFKWASLPDWRKSYADPFIFTDDNGRINVLFEDFSSDKLDGRIALMTCDDTLTLSDFRIVFEADSHLSYPFVFNKGGKRYVFPENAFSGAVYGYELDSVNQKLVNRKKILDFPLIDPTIVEFNGKFWLFGTRLGNDQEQDRLLHIYFADDLFGPYKPHAGNPVKGSLKGSRPAGAFIVVDGELFRPVQNSENYYGENLSINRIKTLNESEFAEEEYLKWQPAAGFNRGLHTLNVSGNTIIVDGLRFYFQPWKQFRRWLKKG